MGKVVSIDQSHELMAKLATSVDWNKLDGNLIQGVIRNFRSNGVAEEFQKFLSNIALSLTINCEVYPYEPNGLMVKFHKTNGLFVWDPKKISLYLSKNQEDPKYISGHNLYEELGGKPVLSANVLDHLEDNQHLIPKEWKQDKYRDIIYIYFWGTIYHDKYQRRYVRCLYWGNNQWQSDYRCLENPFDRKRPAILYLD